MNTTTADASVPTTIDLAGLPEPVVRSIRQLVESLRSGTLSSPPAERPTLRGRYNRPAPEYTPEMFKRDRMEAWADFPREFPEAGES